MNNRPTNFQSQMTRNNTKNNYASADRANNSVRCYKCGRLGHLQQNCRTNSVPKKCYNCGKIGHVQSECRFNKVNYRSDPRIPNRVNFVQDLPVKEESPSQDCRLMSNKGSSDAQEYEKYINGELADYRHVRGMVQCVESSKEEPESASNTVEASTQASSEERRPASIGNFTTSSIERLYDELAAWDEVYDDAEDISSDDGEITGDTSLCFREPVTELLGVSYTTDKNWTVR